MRVRLTWQITVEGSTAKQSGDLGVMHEPADCLGGVRVIHGAF
jgi:hypothetical protein